MPADVSTTVTELPESRVRVQAEVPASEVEKRLAQAARQIGRGMRIPGFRTGKVPPPVIIQRVGRDAVLDEAVRESIAGWYSAAIDAAKVVPVGEPDLNLSELPGEGEPLRFSIEIGVRPEAKLGDYEGLEVGRREPNVGDEAIQAEIEALRERSAKLETTDRAAASGDFVVMDFVGSLDGVPFEGGDARDFMLELGADDFVPGFEEQLEGSAAGDEKTLTVTFPENYRAEHLAGREVEFAVSVKEIKEKILPELDDDLAVEAGFDTLEELREDIRSGLEKVASEQIDAEFREAAVDSAVAAATIDVPDALVDARAREHWEQMAHTLSHQGIPKETYLQIAGKTEDEVIAENRESAGQDLRREAVLAAVVEAEGIEASDEELLESLERPAAVDRTSPKKLLERLRSSGRLDSLRDELAQRKAIDRIADAAKPISVEQAQAREKLWTPGADEPENAAAGGLWTPGS